MSTTKSDIRMIGVRAPSKLAQDLKIQAAREDRSVQAIVIEALSTYLTKGKIK